LGLLFCWNEELGLLLKGRRKAGWQEYLGPKFTRYYKGKYEKKTRHTANLSFYMGG
jgi:hypothetical protein